MYTQDDLEQARADLRQQQERWDNYSGNKPDKYRFSIKGAGECMRTQMAVKEVVANATTLLRLESGPYAFAHRGSQSAGLLEPPSSQE